VGCGGHGRFFSGAGREKGRWCSKRNSFRAINRRWGSVSAKVLEQFPFSFEPVIQSRVKAISYALGDKVVTLSVTDSSLRMVMREQFDAYLLKHVQAEIRQGIRVCAVEERPESVSRSKQRRGNGSRRIPGGSRRGKQHHCAGIGYASKEGYAGAIEIEPR